MNLKHKKWLAGLLSGALAVSLLVPAAFADGEEKPVMSGWAAEEVAKAEALGLNTYRLGGDYTAPIDREGFAQLAVSYVALQNGCDSGNFEGMVADHLAEKNEHGRVKKPFHDVDPGGTGMADSIYAYYLDIVSGTGGGAFSPDRQVTRQEAAAMMLRAYKVCGGALPEEAAEVSFTDAADIATWAKEEAAALSVWGVVKGYEDGRFDPKGSCTIEQAILMFLRLYEDAPVSREKGNVKRLFTYEQALGQMNNWGINLKMGSAGLTVEGPEATFVRQDIGGVMNPPTYLYLIYRDGSIRQLDPGETWKSGSYTASDSEEAHFSEDGKTLTYTFAIKGSKWTDSGTPEAGIYQLTANVDTLECQTVRLRELEQ